VGTDKRARQKELRSSRLEQAKRQKAREDRRRRILRIGGVLAVVGIIVGLLAVFGSGDDQDVESAEATTTTATPEATTTTLEGGLTPAELTGPGPGASIVGETPCPKADGSSERTTSFEKPPPMCIDTSKTYLARFETTKGNIVVTLDAKNAPKTVNNFVVLARYHFYDGSPFFRLIKDFAAQFGDPSERPSNRAQFGYTIPDELPAEGSYRVGSLAMANTGQPNTGGAQAFFILGEQGASLPPQYALLGQTTEGLETLAAINAVPSVRTADNDGAPTEQITINRIVIEER
jgi:cyclophilin family peptidyl-prolyl cis-trans isomerase